MTTLNTTKRNMFGEITTTFDTCKVYKFIEFMLLQNHASDKIESDGFSKRINVDGCDGIYKALMGIRNILIECEEYQLEVDGASDEAIDAVRPKYNKFEVELFEFELRGNNDLLLFFEKYGNKALLVNSDGVYITTHYDK